MTARPNDAGVAEVVCPNCGEDLALAVQAALPSATDLTMTMDVTEGQLMRLDTVAGIMSSFRELQIAVGASMGFDTEVFLAGLSVEGNRFSFTSRIANVVREPSEKQGSLFEAAAHAREASDAQG